jgi:CHAD domain-containing protein
VKARKVKGLDPQAPLADMAERIIRVRLEELRSFVPEALDPARTEALHDMRIAAKRLRYVLEVTGPCFGPYAATAAKRARELQDLIGEIHDCDVMLPLVDAQLREMRDEDAAALRRLADDGDPSPRLAARAPNRAAYRGLEVLAAHLQARRALRFERFARRWAELERGGFAGRLEAAVAQRARPPGTPAELTG